MNLRWLLGNFAEPEYGMSRQQQREVTRLAHKKYLSRTTLSVWTVALVIIGCALVGYGWEPLTALLQGLGLRYARMLAMLAIVIAVSVFAAWMYRYIYVKPVRQAMREMGYDICIGCGYRLQGLSAEVKRCPECGTERKLMPHHLDLHL